MKISITDTRRIPESHGIGLLTFVPENDTEQAQLRKLIEDNLDHLDPEGVWISDGSMVQLPFFQFQAVVGV